MCSSSRRPATGRSSPRNRSPFAEYPGGDLSAAGMHADPRHEALMRHPTLNSPRLARYYINGYFLTDPERVANEWKRLLAGAEAVLIHIAPAPVVVPIAKHLGVKTVVGTVVPMIIPTAHRMTTFTPGTPQSWAAQQPPLLAPGRLGAPRDLRRTSARTACASNAAYPRRSLPAPTDTETPIDSWPWCPSNSQDQPSTTGHLSCGAASQRGNRRTSGCPRSSKSSWRAASPPSSSRSGPARPQVPSPSSRPSPRRSLASAQRALVVTGTDELRGATQAACGNDPSVLCVGFAPLEPLVARSTAAVISGSLGSVGIALHAGKPTVVVPSLFDQAWNGRRIQELGLGRRARTPKGVGDHQARSA